MKKGFKITIKQTDTRNEMHFEVQKSTRANVFKNKKKYTRKSKHKNKFDQEN